MPKELYQIKKGFSPVEFTVFSISRVSRVKAILKELDSRSALKHATVVLIGSAARGKETK